jgi:hypothetical protein
MENEVVTEETRFAASIIIILGMLCAYMIFEAQKHSKGFVFGHEASFVTLLGLIISGLEMVNHSKSLLAF